MSEPWENLPNCPFCGHEACYDSDGDCSCSNKHCPLYRAYFTPEQWRRRASNAASPFEDAKYCAKHWVMVAEALLAELDRTKGDSK